MIKGGGGAHTREKIVATVAKKFICIADETKWTDLLSTDETPLAIEQESQFMLVPNLDAEPITKPGRRAPPSEIAWEISGFDVAAPLEFGLNITHELTAPE